jgi:hypothetical protein
MWCVDYGFLDSVKWQVSHQETTGTVEAAGSQQVGFLSIHASWEGCPKGHPFFYFLPNVYFL